MKNLFIIGGSDFQLPAVLKAKEMGLNVAVADLNPNAVAIPFADKYYNVSTIDENGIYEAAKDFGADGIITLCTDMPMRALAYTCEKLGLSGPSLETAITATDKGEMIKKFELYHVEHPSFLILRKNEKYNLKDFEFPIIVKPTDNSGSRGIMLVENAKELDDAIEYSKKHSRSGDVIIEEFMSGPEVSVEVIVINSKPYILQVTDKLTTGAPHFVEIGHSQPSQLPVDTLEKIKDLAGRAAIAVGIENGPAHAEIIATKNGPKMVEIGARMGGGCITTHLVPLSTGIDMTKATIQIALKQVPDLRPKINKCSAIRFIIPPIGKVVSTSGKEEALSVPGIKVVEIQCSVGQELIELENGTNRIGYVIAQEDSVEEAIKQCEKALSKIQIITINEVNNNV